MTEYVIRRILISIPTLFGITVVIFALVSMAPGDPFAELAMNPDVPPEVRENLRHQLGIDQPTHVRYVKWLGQVIQGNFGYSFVSRIDVKDLIWQRLPTTLFIMGSAQLLAIAIAIPVGVISAIKQYSWWDNIATTFAFIGFSLPTFFTGLLFILIFSIQLGWLPMIYRSDVQASGIDYVIERLRYGIMPIMVLGLAQGAVLTRFVRSSMLDVVRLDYITTARSKGLTERRVVMRHALRNALIPVVTILALQIPGIFTGAVITEQIFRIPGMGYLFISSMSTKDTPVLMAILLIFSVLVVLFNLIADILYGVLDPRIKYN